MALGSGNTQPHHSQADAPVSRVVSSLHEGQLGDHHLGPSVLSAAAHDLELPASEQLALGMHQFTSCCQQVSGQRLGIGPGVQ